MDRADLLEIRMNAVNRKNDAINSRKSIKLQIKYEPVYAKKVKLENEYAKLSRDIASIDSELMDINVKLARLADANDYEYKKVKNPDCVDIVDLAEFAKKTRDKWKEYAEDRTRIASVRIVANDALKDFQVLLNLIGLKNKD